MDLHHFFAFAALSGIAIFTLTLGISNCFVILYDGLLLRDTDALALDNIAQFVTFAAFAAGVEVFKELPVLSQKVFVFCAFTAPLLWIWITRSLEGFQTLKKVKQKATLVWLLLWLVLLVTQGFMVWM
ncbi:hypothetical protein [Anthocerotibacter panamensis]|uniref:hypothetical protein n=1 Tax=Anthocerotibacter panamensis TaxID=2857077 RepID=UPI001C4029AF|nr:hypothetical protein [Anthocerotibacter panamensis]